MCILRKLQPEKKNCTPVWYFGGNKAPEIVRHISNVIVCPQQKATTCHVVVKTMPCNLKQISWFECTALTAIYKPGVYPLRISSWEIVFSSCSIYADVVKPPSELGAPGERHMRRGNIHHKGANKQLLVLHISGQLLSAWCLLSPHVSIQL